MVCAYPGARLNKETREEFGNLIRRYRIHNGMTTIVLQIGSNNLVHHDKAVPDAHPFILEMERALREWLRTPNIRFIVNGILPRAYWLHQELFDTANDLLEELTTRQEFRQRVKFYPMHKHFIHYRGNNYRIK